MRARRLQIVQSYYKNSRFVKTVCSTYGHHNRPTERTFYKIVTQFETQHSLLDNIRPTRLRPAHSEANIEAAAESAHAGREDQFGVVHSTSN